MGMKRILFILSLIAIICSGCEYQTENKKQTLFFFYPWSVNLTHYFENNIANFESSISKKDLKNNRIVVFISQSETEAYMYEIKLQKGIISHDTIVNFINYNYEYTSVEGLTKLLNLVKGSDLTQKFAMIIGCHGDAWIPTKDFKRSFGGGDMASRIDISTLRNALIRSNIKAEYILFDDCYMSSVEVAYELRNVCNYIIASPAEIMATGMPFKDIAKDLLFEANYMAICNEFYNYYVNNQSAPYGAISVIACNELDGLADIMSQIVHSAKIDTMEDIQVYDAYNPHIFFDLGDYVFAICTDNLLLSEFEKKIQRAIPYKATTKYVYAYGFGEIEVLNFSGISTSAPSKNKKTISYEETEWWKKVYKKS